MKKNLDLIQHKIPGVPDAQIKPNAIIFAEEPTLESLNQLAASIKEVEGGTAWWLGDIGLRIQDIKRREWIAANPTLTDELEREAGAARHAQAYTRGRAEILAIDAGYWKNCVSIARFYEPSCRNDRLSVAHHVAAMKGAGGAAGEKESALIWLEKAECNEWSASELRHHVNLSIAVHRNAEKAPLQQYYKALIAADDWAIKHQNDEINPSVAAAWLIQLQALVAYIHNLENAANKQTAK